MKATTAVIIPYFQRESGILRKAVASALRQKDVEGVLIMIVDDGSPVPARTEIEHLLQDHAEQIQIIEQSNAGCAAARNKALDNLPSEVRYVAYLDSDDEWTENHLSNGILALQEGYDFYFSNFFQLDQEVGAFERAGRIVPEHHKKLDKFDSIYAFQGDMFDRIITGNPFGVSTNICDITKFRDLRFREDFGVTGEEYHFWLDVARLGARFVFSMECECRYGAGVNIYSSARWGDDRFLSCTHDEIVFWKAVLKEFDLTESQERTLRDMFERLRENFIRGVLHQIRHQHRVPLSIMVKHFAKDIQTLPFMFGLLFKVVRERSLRSQS